MNAVDVRPWVDREHPKSCSGWFASDATTGDHVCDCGIAEESNSDGLMQHDLGLILTALGLGDHARPDTPHVVVHEVILPAIRKAVKDRDIYREGLAIEVAGRNTHAATCVTPK